MTTAPSSVTRYDWSNWHADLTFDNSLTSRSIDITTPSA